MINMPFTGPPESVLSAFRGPGEAGNPTAPTAASNCANLRRHHPVPVLRYR
jgi:hypothetical protein